MLNRDTNYVPDRSRPLQRKIAEHRERDLSMRNQYSSYDKLNDEHSAYAWTDPGAGGWWGYGGGWSYSWEYWVLRVVAAIVMGGALFVIRSCNGFSS